MSAFTMGAVDEPPPVFSAESTTPTHVQVAGDTPVVTVIVFVEMADMVPVVNLVVPAVPATVYLAVSRWLFNIALAAAGVGKALVMAVFTCASVVLPAMAWNTGLGIAGKVRLLPVASFVVN